ncbi:MAG: GTPase HflX [bacterium]|nr:GTPase HflX [bacterium]
MQKFILVSLIDPSVSQEQANDDLEELKSLVHTYGGASVVKIIQKKDHPDKASFIGSGKAQEVKEALISEKADIVVLNQIVKPTQIYNLQKLLFQPNKEAVVWDRVDLILNIFSKHANTAEAKLQIELAKMRQMGPKIYGMGMVLSRQTGGIGTRGIGETNTELMKRHWRVAIMQVKDKLDKLIAERKRQLERRKEMGVQTVSLVGYTNAGKTTLFNSITKKNKLAENALFATLDSTVGRMYIPDINKEIVVSDTIGFVQNLPPQLVDAFKSTLLESIHSDVLLHIIDLSDPKFMQKIDTVEQILTDLGIGDKKKIYIFNKIDNTIDVNQSGLEQKFADFTPVFISAQNKTGVSALTNAIAEAIQRNI